ncbi:MAG: FAD-binding oxidoreductase [Bacteroidota bacterium]
MTVSPWQRPVDPVDVDIAVVGAGITGAATAFWLRRLEPDARVGIAEAEHVAYGASGRNAGFLLLGIHRDYASAVETYGADVARRIWAFTEETLDLVEAHADPEAVGLAWPGSVIAAGSPDEAARLRHSHRLLGAEGVATEVVEPVDLRARFGIRDLHGALFVPRGGTVDPARLVRWLIRESGAEVWEQCPVASVSSGERGIRLGVAGGGRVEAGRVLVATNAWAPTLVPRLEGVIRPVRAQMLATSPIKPLLQSPVYSHEGYVYVRQRSDGRILLGGARHLHADAEVGYDDATTAPLQDDLEAYLARHLPEAAGATVERRWSGTMGFSPDSLPLLADVEDVPGALVAAGFTGHGMAFGMRFGLLAARALLGRPDPTADLFHSDRLKRTEAAGSLN